MTFFTGLFVAFVLNCSAANEMSPRPSRHIRDDGPLLPHIIEKLSEGTVKKQHIIWPKDGADTDTNNKTEIFLKEVTKRTDVYSYTASNKLLRFWLVNITDLQVGTIGQNESVAEVQEDTKYTLNAVLLSPSAPAKLSVSNKVERDGIQYTT